MAMYLRRFTVRGSGEFPLDMLRYDSCWPKTGHDVAALEDHTARRDVRLCKYAANKRGPFFEAGRWRSFGWEAWEV